MAFDKWIQPCNHHDQDILLVKEILPLVKTWVNLEGIILCEICQKEKQKNYMIPLICGHKWPKS